MGGTAPAAAERGEARDGAAADLRHSAHSPPVSERRPQAHWRRSSDTLVAATLTALVTAATRAPEPFSTSLRREEFPRACPWGSCRAGAAGAAPGRRRPRPPRSHGSTAPDRR